MKPTSLIAACLAALVVLAVASQSVQAQQKALYLFGGTDHKVFLGCMNCANASASSVCNAYGKYGSKFNPDSIWNQFGTYGSKFNSSSPWNQFSRSAPIIVDNDGGSYGYFSRNTFHQSRTRIKWLVAILDFYADKDDLDETRDAMCKD